MPMLFHEYLDFSDPVLKFDRLISEIDLKEFISSDKGGIGCTRYNAVDLLKTVLFGFMDCGYCSLRELEDRCKVDIPRVSIKMCILVNSGFMHRLHFITAFVVKWY